MQRQPPKDLVLTGIKVMKTKELLEFQGYAWHRAAVCDAELCNLKDTLDALVSGHDYAASIRGSSQIVGARNLLDFWPECGEIAKLVLKAVPDDELTQCLRLVRVLYFDKPPGRSWALPLHRDETVAVDELPDRSLMPDGFSRPTVKSGVCHLVAPAGILNQMFTLRLHLDDMNERNGPLYVVPGSHADDDDREQGSYANMTDLDRSIEVLRAEAGDVLIMRPRLLHGSLESEEGNTQNRRILHFEFAPHDALPRPLKWKWSDAMN